VCVVWSDTAAHGQLLVVSVSVAVISHTPSSTTRCRGRVVDVVASLMSSHRRLLLVALVTCTRCILPTQKHQSGVSWHTFWVTCTGSRSSAYPCHCLCKKCRCRRMLRQ